MEEYGRSGQEGKSVFVGVDLHRFKWHVTLRTEDQELFSGTIPGEKVNNTRSIIGGVSEKYRFVVETLILTQPERPASNLSPLPKGVRLRCGTFPKMVHKI